MMFFVIIDYSYKYAGVVWLAHCGCLVSFWLLLVYLFIITLLTFTRLTLYSLPVLKVPLKTDQPFNKFLCTDCTIYEVHHKFTWNDIIITIQ